MATNIVQGKWDPAEDEEDTLSLCDLSPTLINNHDHQTTKEDSNKVNENTQEEFNFHSWGGDGHFSKEPEMCAADEVFFQGQILPLRLSFSSEAGLLTTATGNILQRNGKQFKSRSESLDHNSNSLSEFHSNSSRSSSIRSQNSSTSSSTNSTTTTTITTPIISKPKIRNQFHTHPSPKPQLRLSAPKQPSFGNQTRKSSSVWEIFRLGVVPTPEIGLQDLKVRSTNSANKTCVSRNSSSSSNNSGKMMSSDKINESTRHHSNKRDHHILKHFVGKGGGLLSGCDCSIETVQYSDMVMIKGGTKSTEKTTHAVKEKVVELKNKKQRQKQGKKVMSRRRTFEWLKELHASSHLDDDEALLSNPS